MNCICASEWLTNYGECTNCAQSFPGCSQCRKVTNEEDQTGVSVVQNDNFASTEPGTYVCSQCSEPSTFFNYDLYQCLRCDTNVSGCKSCSSGRCSECEEGYALMSNGGCYDCSWFSGGCARCTEFQCEECKSNYEEIFGICVIKVF